MKPEVYITSTKNNTESDLIDAIKACFDQFGGLENILKGNIFIKINATAMNVNAITTPKLIIDENRIVLNDLFENIELEIPENFQI